MDIPLTRVFRDCQKNILPSGTETPKGNPDCALTDTPFFLVFDEISIIFLTEISFNQNYEHILKKQC